jgi:hypothetical protein
VDKITTKRCELFITEIPAVSELNVIIQQFPELSN